MLFSEMRLKLFKVIRTECDRQLFSSVDIVKYGYANSKLTLFLRFFECLSSSTVDIDRRPIFFLYEPTDLVDIDRFLGTMNRTDRRYRPRFSVSVTEPTVDMDRVVP